SPVVCASAKPGAARASAAAAPNRVFFIFAFLATRRNAGARSEVESRCGEATARAHIRMSCKLRRCAENTTSKRALTQWIKAPPHRHASAVLFACAAMLRAKKRPGEIRRGVRLAAIIFGD
ncbi:MAG TPA: hypothetical protein PLS69_12390, partial [Terricaulis sp.]|nr:hypothetical protein [Terricaulis sp.]